MKNKEWQDLIKWFDARVDWEKEAGDILDGYMADGGELGNWCSASGNSLEQRIAKALSNAFEKGREAK